MFSFAQNKQKNYTPSCFSFKFFQDAQAVVCTITSGLARKIIHRLQNLIF